MNTDDFNNAYPPPTQIIIDEHTDMTKMHEKVGIARTLIAMMIFDTPKEFMDWQREAPREIYEITTKLGIGSMSNPIIKIIVTYNGGIIQ